MAFIDPAERALIRMEIRRFVARCESNEGLVQRGDSLREMARLAATVIPYKVANEPEARDAQRRLALAAEDRAKELILLQISGFVRAEAELRPQIKSKMFDDWGNLSGALAHLRSWANGKLSAAEQAL